MKKLTRIKLINWHRFTDATINIGDSTLISGENGAGKSTLLDAVQFVVTCSASHFNKAAHENGKRKLTGYIRCKTGRENRPYERTGEISAHVALEFYEESKDRYFVIGAAIDSATEGQETVVRYLMDNVRLSDDMFKSGNKPRTITEFRVHNSKKIKQFCKTNAEAKKMIKQRFGRIEDKFFSLIPKALAFKPIDDIKDFVYSYVLDEKEVNIDALRENVRSYQELEKTLEGVKKRIESLKDIEKYHAAVEDCIKSDHMYEYFLARADHEINEEALKKLEALINRESAHYQELIKDGIQLRELLSSKNDTYTTLLAELKQDSDFQALQEKEKDLRQLKNRQIQINQEHKELKKASESALKQIEKLNKAAGEVPSVLQQYEDLLKNIIEGKLDAENGESVISDVYDYKSEQFNSLQLRKLELEGRKRELQEKNESITEKIRELKRQRFQYPPEVNALKRQIEQEFARLSRKAEPHILCELLEITNEQWRNAAEGYLNTQRFYIIVEPENFDIALGVYEKMRRSQKIYGVGLVNSARLEAYDTVPEGSLASVISTKSIHARRYINMVLGKVHMCSRYDELKQYDVAITKQCMRYQNRVASAIKPSVYEKPYIGQNAIRIQLEQSEKEAQELKHELEGVTARLNTVILQIGCLDTKADMDVRYRLNVLSEVSRIRVSISQCTEDVKQLKAKSTYIEKNAHLDELKNDIDRISSQVSAKDRETGSSEERQHNLKEQFSQKEAERTASAEEKERLESQNPESAESWKTDYLKQTQNRAIEQFRINFDRRKKGNLTQKENALSEMRNHMIDYKTSFDFGAAASYEAYPEYAAVLDRLTASELLQYEEKVEKARISAEEEFREQFLSKLQENMKQAQSEFRELNKALEDIAFSSERYQFIYMPAKRYSRYYDMIMDDFNVVQGESIFSGLFHENHKEVIDELFEKLTHDSDNETKTLDEFTDYRTYMDYDIKIIHSDGNYSLYSKVCEEKSGGETQTPFYVTVAASFVQLYGSNIGGESIGLILFDEAFNNMDDERIGGVLEFLSRLPLQIIIAAPPDKIQYIGPSMEETLLVLTDGKVSFTEEYRHESIRK